MGYRLTKIYTKTGDKGTTSLDGRTRLSKNNLKIIAAGELDELNCALGYLLAHEKLSYEIRTALSQIQHELFNLGGELCIPAHIIITQEKVRALESLIDQWNETLPPLKEFLLPGGNPPIASCHLARAICRRAERALVALYEQEPFNSFILSYINRLSDVLFVAARYMGREMQCPEILWEHQR